MSVPEIMPRRQFLGMVGGAVWTAGPLSCGVLAEARALVRTGAIGRVSFCRASNRQWLRLAREICPEDRLLAELDRNEATAGCGAVLLGSRATLVVDQKGWHLLP
jgi:hypothetical protein